MAEFQIHDYTEPVKAGQYDEQVKALRDANEKAGKSLAIDVQVPADKVKSATRAFQVSAKNFDRTGRLVAERPQDDGSVVLEFILVDRIERKPKAVEATSEAVPSNNVPTAA